jgi:DNA-binding winged helix-turn-helix (wHTH) protein
VSAFAVRLYFDDFELDADQVELRRAGTLIKAEPRVLRLLEVLLLSAGKLVTKEELIAQVWDGRAVAENVITVAMVRLRKALGHTAGQREFVNNVHGRGYRFVCPVKQQPAPPDAPQAIRTPRPFVGRERLLDALTRALADADAGHGNACVLTGEPGIGKTRALEELERHVNAAGMFMAWGHCRESEDTPPLWPFAQILRHLHAWSSKHDLSAEQPEWTAEFPELAMLLPELWQRQAAQATDAISSAPKRRLAKHQVFDAIIRLLTRASEQQTCVLVLDDLHRADAASLELLQSWVDQLSRMRILLLAAFPRVEHARAAARAQLAYVYGHRNTTRLTLKPLSEDEVASYVRALIEGTSSELTHAVFVKSEGNPFFMNELVRQLRSSEQATSDLAMPEAVLELVRRRLAILDEEARGALSYAAVIGRRFELSTLQAVTGEDARALMTSLDAALASEVVLRVPDSATAFMFAHELLRVALCDALTPAYLRKCHLRVALALEERPLGGAQSPVANLAFHFHAALPESDLRKTVQYCSAAAQESIHLFALADGRRHLRHARQALELMDKPSQRLRLNMLLREAVLARDCSDAEFEPLLREAIRLAGEQEMWPQLAWAGIMLNLNPGFPALSGSREVLEQALEGLAPNELMRAAVLARLATSAPLGYDARASSEQVARALDIALHSDEDLPMALLLARAAQLYLFGNALDQTQASEAMRALVPLSQQLVGRITRAPMLLDLHRAIRSLQTGDLSAFDAALERCEATSRKLGEHELDWYVERARAMQRINVGDAETGVRQLQALHQRGRQSAPPGSLLLQAYDQCVVSASVSSLSAKELRAALEHDSADSPNICALKVRALARAGMHDEAHAQLLAIAPERIASLPRDRDYLGTLGALVHAVIDLHANAYVEALYGLLAEYPEHFAADGSFACEPLPQLMGLLARSQGRQCEATSLLARGAAMAERAGLASVGP